MGKDYKKLYEETFEQLKETISQIERYKEAARQAYTDKKTADKRFFHARSFETRVKEMEEALSPSEKEMIKMKKKLQSYKFKMDSMKYALSRIFYHSEEYGSCEEE